MRKILRHQFGYSDEATAAARTALRVGWVCFGLFALCTLSVAAYAVFDRTRLVSSWPLLHCAVLALTALHAYLAFIFVRQSSRVYYEPDQPYSYDPGAPRKALHGFVRDTWLTSPLLKMFEYGRLLPSNFWACSFGFAISLLGLLGFSWPPNLGRVVLAITLVSLNWVTVGCWTQATIGLITYSRLHLHRRMYLSVYGIVPLPLDRATMLAPHEISMPCCFFSYHGGDREKAMQLAAALRSASIEVEMYDPKRLWNDAPLEIIDRIDKQAHCLVYYGRNLRRSPWVRVEQELAQLLGRQIFRLGDEKNLGTVIQLVRRSQRIPRPLIFSKDDRIHGVLQRYLPGSQVITSEVTNRGLLPMIEPIYSIRLRFADVPIQFGFYCTLLLATAALISAAIAFWFVENPIARAVSLAFGGFAGSALVLLALKERTSKQDALDKEKRAFDEARKKDLP